MEKQPDKLGFVRFLSIWVGRFVYIVSFLSHVTHKQFSTV